MVSWSVLSGNWGSTSGYPQRVYAKMVHGVEAFTQRANMGLVFLFHAGDMGCVHLPPVPPNFPNFPSHQNHIETLNIANDPCIEY